MTEEALNPNDVEADAARSSLVDAIQAAENGTTPLRHGEHAGEQSADAAADSAATAAQEAESARLALQAALQTAENAAAEARAAEAQAAAAAAAEEARVAAEADAVRVAAEDEAARAQAAAAEEARVAEASASDAAPEIAPEEPVAAETSAPDAAPEEPVAVETPVTEIENPGIDQMIESLEEARVEIETQPDAEIQEPETTQDSAPAGDSAPDEAASTAAASQPQVAAPAIVIPEDRGATNVALWPFLVYLGSWLVFAGVYIWRFIELPAERAVFDQPDYGVFVAVAIVLAVTGPVVALAAWMTSWGKQGATKSDLLVSALVRGSIVTFGGVSIWWLAYILVDLLRLGRVL